MKIQALLRRVLVGPALFALFLGAPLSHATELIATGFANSFENFTLSLPPGGVEAGGFVGTFGGSPLTFWCGELTQTFNWNDPQDYTATIFTNSNLSKLF